MGGRFVNSLFAKTQSRRAPIRQAPDVVYLDCKRWGASGLGGAGPVESGRLTLMFHVMLPMSPSRHSSAVGEFMHSGAPIFAAITWLHRSIGSVYLRQMREWKKLAFRTGDRDRGLNTIVRHCGYQGSSRTAPLFCEHNALVSARSNSYNRHNVGDAVISGRT